MNALLFVAALIFGDVETPSPVQRICVACEIMDPREANYVLGRRDDLACDMALLCRRSEDLADAPRANEAERFPAREYCNEALSFNRAHLRQLEVSQSARPHLWFEYAEAVRETERLYLIWDKVRDARCEYYYLTVRRAALADLRKAIGWEQFYAGWMPPHVPLANFREVR